ncbi:hypothetical protein NEIRO03_2035 [Nematocida sp. AWRm78]|nr:hypothetical protein NEIRO02_2011 [Nematocida sp. AWRm79]KAI5185447.1 hypothetical protein NEIRO03_2035 [Nematocida sp. AWRm78]
MRKNTKYIFAIGILIIKLSLVYTDNNQKEVAADPDNEKANIEIKLNEFINFMKNEECLICNLKKTNDEIQCSIDLFLNKEYKTASSKKPINSELSNPEIKTSQNESNQSSIVNKNIYAAIESKDLSKNLSTSSKSTGYKLVDIPILTPCIENYYALIIEDFTNIIDMCKYVSIDSNNKDTFENLILDQENMAKYFLSLTQSPHIFLEFSFNDLLKYGSSKKYFKMIKDKDSGVLKDASKTFDKTCQDICRFFAYLSNQIYLFVAAQKEFNIHTKTKLISYLNMHDVKSGSEPKSPANKISEEPMHQQYLFAWRLKNCSFVSQINELLKLLVSVLEETQYNLSSINISNNTYMECLKNNRLNKVCKQVLLLKNEIVATDTMQIHDKIVYIQENVLQLATVAVKLMREIVLSLYKKANYINAKAKDKKFFTKKEFENGVSSLWNISTTIQNYKKVLPEYEKLDLYQYTKKLESDLNTIISINNNNLKKEISNTPTNSDSIKKTMKFIKSPKKYITKACAYAVPNTSIHNNQKKKEITTEL